MYQLAVMLNAILKYTLLIFNTLVVEILRACERNVRYSFKYDHYAHRHYTVVTFSHE